MNTKDYQTFRMGTPKTGVSPSDSMYHAMLKGAQDGLIGSAAHLSILYRRLDPILKEEVQAVGMMIVLSACRRLAGHKYTGTGRRGRVGPAPIDLDGTRKQLEKMQVYERERSAKRSSVFSAMSRLIDKLDSLDVGGKRLGDCSRADLLKEAARLETAANGMVLEATWYRELASMIGNGRVRDLSIEDRKTKLIPMLEKKVA